MSAEAILDALDDEQRDVATALHGPVCVLAGAGTGKTRAITHRIAYGVTVNAYNPQAVLAVTFTARAAGEMRTRLRSLGVPGVQARTFHAAALRQLSYFWPEVVGGQLPAIVEQKATLVARAARSAGQQVDRVAVRDLASEIEWAKVSLVDPSDYERAIARRSRPAPAGLAPAIVADVMRAYEEVKTQQVVIDFEDILLLLSDIIGRHHEVGDQIRRQYRHFVVDEYQDVSPLQQYLLDQWLGGREDLCVVGDAAQTIYSFTGASPRHLLDFRRTYPDATVVRLVRDYRSTPQVVALANDIAGARASGVELIAQRPPGPPPAYVTCDHDEAEATWVASRIRDLVAAGVAASEIAILYRTNGQSEAFEEALAAHGIGYLVRGGQRFFEREEVRKAVLLLRAAAVSPADGSLGELVRATLADAGWSEAPPAARGSVRERWDSLQALVDLADDVDASTPGATIREFVEHLADRAQAQHAPAIDGVTLTSIHAAKGLEWEAVFVVGCSEGLLPISLAETPEAIDEERRLMYVAVTRARQHLTLSYARARRDGGKATRKVSRFLESRWPRVQPVAARRTSTADRLKELGAQDARLFESLREWRTATAQADGKPAYTVLVDSSLLQIARDRPATLADLGRVGGVGASKLDKYGAEILAIVASA